MTIVKLNQFVELCKKSQQLFFTNELTENSDVESNKRINRIFTIS